MDLRQCSSRLEALFRRGTIRDVLFPEATGACVGLGHESSAHPYDWSGLARGGDPRHPLALIQYTLSGWGLLKGPRLPPYRVMPGQAFLVTIPSDHRYWLPLESSSWSFVWALIQHPYAVPRLEREIRGVPALLELPPTTTATTDLLHVVSGVAQGRFVGDLWAFEQAVFALMLSWSRALAHQRLPSGPCEALLASVRTHLRQQPPGFVAVEDLAAAAGMSRSRYTRHFTTITGWSPAAFIAHVRLEQVRHDLMNGNDTLDRLAERHGFADANHLCKAFRRAFAITPGIFRQQTRGQRATEQGA